MIGSNYIDVSKGLKALQEKILEKEMSTNFHSVTNIIKYLIDESKL